MILGHGGNKEELAKEIGCAVDEIVDMSSNLNPLGPPEIVEKTIQENLDKIRSLPEPDAKSMRQGFARFHNIDPNQVVAGNGTTFFIYTLPVALSCKKVLIVGPTYSDYKDACQMCNIEFAHCHSTVSNDFLPDIDKISSMAEKADTIFLCNPNNPTGVLVSREKIEYLLSSHPDTLFVVDESYLPFVDQAENISMVGKTGHDNLVVLSSMSKIFQIPGLRTGFLSSTPRLAQKVMNHYQPWSVNALAQSVITAIFDHPEIIRPFYEKTRAFVKEEKKLFMDDLKEASGLKLFDSDTYFILAQLTGNKRSKEVCKEIGKSKLLIRDCSNFEGLTDEFVRFSLKEREINQRLSKQIVESM